MNESNQSSEKCVWTEQDFDEMVFSKCSIYGMWFPSRKYTVSFDIDYICGWEHPAEGETHYKFAVAPATLRFQNVYDFKVDFPDMDFLELEDITRKDSSKPPNGDAVGRSEQWRWTMSCRRGKIEFNSVGYRLVIREEPTIGISFSLDRIDLRPVSFSEVPYRV